MGLQIQYTRFVVYFIFVLEKRRKKDKNTMSEKSQLYCGPFRFICMSPIRERLTFKYHQRKIWTLNLGTVVHIVWYTATSSSLQNYCWYKKYWGIISVLSEKYVFHKYQREYLFSFVFTVTVLSQNWLKICEILLLNILLLIYLLFCTYFHCSDLHTVHYRQINFSQICNF